MAVPSIRIANVLLLSILVSATTTSGFTPTTVTPQECFLLIQSVADNIIVFFESRTCDRTAVFVNLNNQCGAGACDGLDASACRSTLRGLARGSLSQFCDSNSGFDDLPLAIKNFVTVEVGFTVPEGCWPSRVCLGITHPSMGDMTISLRNPANRRFLLQDQQGGSGANLQACYSNMDRPKVKRANLNPERVPVIRGNFRPSRPLPSSPMPGSWTLRVFDREMRNQGTWDSADVEFTCV